MLDTPFAPWPSYTEEEVEAVASVLRSNRVNYWTGNEGRQFEREFAGWCGSAHAVAVTNGTVALDVALRAVGIGPGDEVIVTPRTFIASVSSVILAGATPIFADVDLNSGNISPATITPVLTERTRAILPVHLGGWPCDMPGIMTLARERGLSVIEDCAQAHGARVHGKSVGTFGQIGAWSFCQDKIMTTGGEGGMVTTDDPDLWARMWSFKDHGKSMTAVERDDHAPGFRWLHEGFGTNWRMLEFQAAIGRLQLRKMPEWSVRRGAIGMRLAAALRQAESIVRVPLPPEGYTHAFYRLYAYLRPEALKHGWTRDRIIAAVNDAGVPLYHGTCSEVYLEKAFEATRLGPSQRLPNALSLGETSLMFLTHPTLTDEEVARMCDVTSDVLREATA